MQLLGSPQGSHDAPAHLLSIPHRVQHASPAAGAEPCPPCLLFCCHLLPASLGCVDAEQTTGAAVEPPTHPSHTPPVPLRYKQFADGGEQLLPPESRETQKLRQNSSPPTENEKEGGREGKSGEIIRGGDGESATRGQEKVGK